MAYSLPTATRNALVQQIQVLIDQSTGAGKIKFYTAADGLLVTLTFSDPSFPSANTGVLTASAITSGTATGTGTAAKADLTDSADVVIVTALTVGTSASDINLSSVGINTGDTVSISSFTVTMPAS